MSSERTFCSADMRDSRTHQEPADKEFSIATLRERRRHAVAVLANHRISIKLRNYQYATPLAPSPSSNT